MKFSNQKKACLSNSKAGLYHAISGVFQKHMDFVDMRSAVGFGTRPYESHKKRV